MLLYYPFWMFMGFILHIYIIFGTNLLTRGPSQIAVFLVISLFQIKRISNGVQTEWNLREHDFWNERDPEDLDPTSRKLPGSHEVGGRALHPRDHLFCSLEQGPSLMDHVRWENHVPEDFIPFFLRFIWIFCETKNMQQTGTGTGHWINMLVPK